MTEAFALRWIPAVSNVLYPKSSSARPSINFLLLHHFYPMAGRPPKPVSMLDSGFDGKMVLGDGGPSSASFFCFNFLTCAFYFLV